MDEPQAYLNGRFVPASAAAVPLGDAGFVLGATVAEQLRTFGGKLFRLDEHLGRLARSLGAVGVDPGLSPGGLADAARQLAARNHALLAPGDDLGLSVFVTPGTYAAYAPPGPPAPPMVCMHTYPLPFRLWAEKYEAGQSLVTASIRQVPPECWPSWLKCRSRMHYYLADREVAARQPGARALLLDAEGLVIEASTANVLVYRRGEGLVSPPAGRILPGISLATVCELAGRLDIAHCRRDLVPEDLAAADEVMLTSTPFCLLPVTRVDGHPVGQPGPGPVFGRLLAAWGEAVGLDIAAQARRLAAR